MSNQKTSEVSSCHFLNEWQSPSGVKVFYHRVVFENGDTVNFGATTVNPDKLAVGAPVTYEVDEKGKGKIINTEQKKGNQNYAGGNYKKKADDYLGYAWSYAKDLIIAGKTSKDMAEMEKIAKKIYDNIKKMIAEQE